MPAPCLLSRYSGLAKATLFVRPGSAPRKEEEMQSQGLRLGRSHCACISSSTSSARGPAVPADTRVADSSGEGTIVAMPEPLDYSSLPGPRPHHAVVSTILSVTLWIVGAVG